MSPAWRRGGPPTSGRSLRNRVRDPDVAGSGACDHVVVSSTSTDGPPPRSAAALIHQTRAGPVPAPAAAAPLALRRRRSGRVLAGVAGGVADHLGADVLWVRAAFVALTAVTRRRSGRLRAAVDLHAAGGRLGRARRAAARAPAGTRAGRARPRCGPGGLGAGQLGARLDRRAARGGRRGSCRRVAGGRRGAAPTVDGGRPTQRRLAGRARAGGSRCALRGQWHRGVPAGQPRPRPGPVRVARGARHPGRRRRADRAVVGAARPRPRRGASPAHPGGRARRDRRPPARLRAADARVDPATVGLAPRGGAPGARAGARAAELALRPWRLPPRGRHRRSCAAGGPRRRAGRRRRRGRRHLRAHGAPGGRRRGPLAGRRTCARWSSPPARRW